MNFSFIFAADDECLTNIELGNITQNRNFYCDDFNFINKTGIHNCNGYTLNNGYGYFKVENANLTFLNCNIIQVPAMESDINTSIYFYNSNFNDDNDFSNFNGSYYIYKNITINVLDYEDEPLDVFKINLTSQTYPQDSFELINTTSQLIPLFMYIDGAYSTWNNYDINVSSTKFGSSNLSIFDFSNSVQTDIYLEDLLSPNLTEFSLIEATNNSLNVNFSFDEKVSGIFEIYNSSGTVEQIDINDNLTNHNILFSNLNVDSFYDFDCVVQDRFGHSYGCSNLQSIKTYQTLNISYNESDNFYELEGDPENTTSFNFSSISNNIKVQFLEPVNIQDKNLSNSIIFGNNLLRIEDNEFLKSAKVYFENLNFQSMPYILKDGIVCQTGDCLNQNYNNSIFSFNETILDENVNYSLVSNSILRNFTTPKLVGKNITFYANYTDFNSTQSILANCTFEIDGNGVNYMNYNNSLYEYIIPAFYDNSSHIYSIECFGNNSYDDKQILNEILYLDYQQIGNFTTNVQFEDEGSKLTKKKWIKVDIDSNNLNTNESLDLNYSFMVTRDITYPRIDWENYNLTNWIDIGKNESFEIFNNGEEYTSYNLSNDAYTGNFSQFVFIDERDANGDGTTLYVVVKACVPGGACKYYANENNNLIYEDITSPKLVDNNIEIGNYYNSKSRLIFTYKIRDLESKVDSVRFRVINATGLISSPNNVIGFNENENYTYNQSGFDFIEGGSYKILLDATNKVDLKSNIFQSNTFLIDTRAPINSTLNISLNNNSYYDSSLLNVNFSAGRDYNISYDSLGIEASGLDYMKLYIQNASLVNDECVNWGDKVQVNDTFDENDTSYKLNISTGYCYDVFYRVYDKAGNYNEVKFDRTIKYDNSSPVLTNIAGDNVEIYDYTIADGVEKKNADNIQRSLSQLSQNPTLFYVKWNITDDESSMDYYNIELINNDTGAIVKTFENYTENKIAIDYNKSYIFDNVNYKVRVIGVNKAGLLSGSLITDGATVFIFKLPVLEFGENYYMNENKILDLTNNGITTLKFNDTGDFNISCQISQSDTGYDKEASADCISNGAQVECDFPTILGLNKYYVSCKSDESATDDERIYNNQTNNFDLDIFVEENNAPYLNLSQINVSEDEVLDLNIFDKIIDNNTLNYLIGNYSLQVQNLTISVSGPQANLDNLVINFYNVNVNQSSLDISDAGATENAIYDFYFNGSINYSEIQNLCLNNSNCKLNFKVEDNNWAQKINLSSSYSFIDANKVFTSGISNNKEFINLTNSENYNFSFDKNGNIYWDLENNSIRQKSFNLTFWLSDNISLNKQNITVNVLSIFYPPKINYTYYNFIDGNNVSINKIFDLVEYEVKTIDLSKYFYEENSMVGLNESLTYLYKFLSNLNVKTFNQTSGELEVYSSKTGDASMQIGVINNNNQSIYTNLSFNIGENSDSTIPQINVVSPINNYNLNSALKVLNFDVRSNENLASIKVNLNGTDYILCKGFCLNISKEYPILNLKEGNNNLTFTIEDFGGNVNNKSVNVIYNFDNSGDVKDTIYSNVADGNSQFYVENETNLSQSFSGEKQVLFKDNLNNTYVDFVYNFSNNFTFENSSVMIDNSTDFVSMFVSGIELGNYTKNIYLPISSNLDYSSICIKDDEIFSFTQISNLCNGNNEYYLSCDGTSQNGYSCSQIEQNNNSFYEILGLRHSGVKLMCTEDWSVGDWGSCVSSKQTRTVTDLNNCGTVFNKPISTQSCSSGGSSGGGSSHHSSSSSSSTYVPPQTNESKNETKNNSNSTPVKTPSEPEDNSIYLGNLNSGVSSQLNLNENYSFYFNGKEINGKLVQSFDEYIFETEAGNFYFSNSSFDSNNDGVDDLVIYLSQDLDGNIYLNSEKIKVENSNNENVDETPLDNSNLDEDDSVNSILIYVIIILVLICLGVGSYFGYKYYLSHKHISEDMNVEKVKADIVNRTIQDSLNEKKVEGEVAQIYQSFDSLTDKLVLYSENLSEIVETEKDLIDLIKQDTIKLINKGFSWTDTYFYLKSKNISNFYINKVIDFKPLINKLENFILENNVSEMSSDVLKQKLLSQKWIGELYIYDSSGEDILRDVLFMIAGSHIYGFRRNKFEDLFKEELENGKKQFVSFDFKKKFEEMNFSTEDYELLTRIENDLEILQKDVVEFNSMVKRTNLSEKEKSDLLEISNELLDDIKKHLE